MEVVGQQLYRFSST